MNLADDRERRMAVDPERSVIVQAPAGSGKTTLLVERYLRLLACVQRPEEILAITFTVKAAAEMRERIVSALVAPDTQVPAAARSRPASELEAAAAARARDAELGWGLTANPSRIRVQTIDAFAMWLNQKLPVSSGFDSSARITDAPDELYRQAARSLFTEPYRNHPLASEIADFVALHDNHAGRAETLIARMLAKRDQWLNQVSAFFGTSRTDPEGLHQLLTMSTFKLRSDTTARFLKTLSQHETEQLLAIAAHLGLDDNLHELADRLLTRQHEARRTLNKNQGFPVEARTQKREALDWLAGLQHSGRIPLLADIRRLPEPDATEDGLTASLQVCVLVLALAALALNRVFRRNRAIDFTEVMLSAERALAAPGEPDSPTELALWLDYRINHILVDEFQDTSAAQYRLLEKLTAGWSPFDPVSFFAVGDPMQSIYRFRDADVGLFTQTAEHGLAGFPLEWLQLSTNFRSRPHLIEWGNNAFARAFGEFAQTHSGRVAHAPSIAARPADPSASLYRTAFASDDAEINAVIAHVAQCLAAKPTQDGYPGLSTIAILVRSRAHLRNLLPQLKAAGINWQATDIDPLGEQTIVVDLAMLHRLLSNPRDRLAWAAFLRSPLVGMSPHDMERVLVPPGRNILKALEELVEPPASHKRLRAVLPILRRARSLVFERTAREVVQHCWLQLGGTYACSSDTSDTADTSEVMKDAEAFFAMLDQLAPDDWNPQSVATRLERLFAPGVPGARLSILTMHKAKGLEFDHVILPFLDRDTRRELPDVLLWRTAPSGMSDDGSDMHPDCDTWHPHHMDHGLLMATQHEPLYQWLKYENDQRAHNESARLLYVAATRARESLWLSTSHVASDSDGNADGRPPTTGLAQWLPDGWRIDTTSPTSSGLQTESARSAVPTSGEPPRLSSPLNVGPLKEDPPQTTLRRLPASFRWRPPGEAASQTQTQHFHTADMFSEGAPEEPAYIDTRAVSDSSHMRNKHPKRQIANTPPGSDTATAIGTVIHNTLAWLGECPDEFITTLATVPAARQFCKARHALWEEELLLLNTTPEVARSSAITVARHIQNTLTDVQGQWLLAGGTEAVAELALTVFDGESYKQQIVDRTFVDTRGTRWVVDYKTSEPRQSGATGPESREAFTAREQAIHLTQLQGYRRAVDLQARSISGNKAGSNPGSNPGKKAASGMQSDLRIGLYFTAISLFVDITDQLAD